MVRRGKGWRNEPLRHSLARKGVKTGRKTKTTYKLKRKTKFRTPLTVLQPSYFLSSKYKYEILEGNFNKAKVTNEYGSDRLNSANKQFKQAVREGEKDKNYYLAQRKDDGFIILAKAKGGGKLDDSGFVTATPPLIVAGGF